MVLVRGDDSEGKVYPTQSQEERPGLIPRHEAVPGGGYPCPCHRHPGESGLAVSRAEGGQQPLDRHFRAKSLAWVSGRDLRAWPSSGRGHMETATPAVTRLSLVPSALVAPFCPNPRLHSGWVQAPSPAFLDLGSSPETSTQCVPWVPIRGDK